jgi:hypothetical protein
MNEKVLWVWRVAVLVLLLFIGDSLRNIYRVTPSLPYRFSETIEDLSRDVSAMREKISPKPAPAPEPKCATDANGKEFLYNGLSTLYQWQLDQSNAQPKK